MAVEGVMIRDGNCIAAQDFSNTGGLAGPNGSGQFLAVKLSSAADRSILLATSPTTSDVYGILQNKPKLGDAGDVCYSGISKAVYGGTVVAGNLLTVDASGRLVAAATGNWVTAKAIVAGVLGDVATVEVVPLRLVSP
jgi:hypothetical protein